MASSSRDDYPDSLMASSSTDVSQASSSTESAENSSNFRFGPLAVYRSLVRAKGDGFVPDVKLLSELHYHFDQFSDSYKALTSVLQAEDVLLHIRMMDAARFFVNGIAISVRLAEVNKESQSSAASCEKQRDTSFKILFSAIHNPQLLGQLNAMLWDINYEVKEAQMFRAKDGCALYAFDVIGKNQDLKVLAEKIAMFLISNKYSGVKLVAEERPPHSNAPPVFCKGCKTLKFNDRCKCFSPLPPLTSVFCRFCKHFSNRAGCSCPVLPRPTMLPRALWLQGYQEKPVPKKSSKEKRP